MAQRPIHAPVTTDVTLSCVDPWGGTVDVPTTLRYRSDDPYAVALVFHSGVCDVEWIVSRTLLQQGLAAPAGEGDVRLHPSQDGGARAVTVLDFSSPDGHLIARADSGELQSFLTRTFAVVPIGTEHRHLDLDGLVAALLGSATAE